MKVGFQMPNEVRLQTLFRQGARGLHFQPAINSYGEKWTQF